MNSFGKIFKVTTWGESHGKAIGVVIDGVPSNIELTEDYLNRELERRNPLKYKFSTKRRESDRAIILSGVFENKTLGTPISVIVFNEDVKSEHYENLKDVFRPGHADYTYFKKFGIRDWRGGGRASARETVARVVAGAIAKKILEKYKIKIFSYTVEIAGIKAEKINLNDYEKREFFFADPDKLDEIIKFAEKIKKQGDSFGGIVEVKIENLPSGLGEPVFDKFDAVLSHAIMSIGATKGIEFGLGFNSSKILGSENNDEMDKNGFITNNSGGILGGITTGQDLIFRVAIKPIPSILKKQKSIDISGNEKLIEISGRHDVCAIPRINVVIEAMTWIVIADFILLQKRMEM